MDYLKSKTVEIKSIGESLVLKQLSAAAWEEVLSNKDRPMLSSAIICKHGVNDWREKTPEDICLMLTPETINEIADAVQDLGGLSKNSVSTPADGSSST